MTIPPLYAGVSDFYERYDYFLIDVWGVLHDGKAAYEGAPEALQFLKDQGKKILLLSNSPNRAARVAEKVLRANGIPDNSYDYLLTSGEAAHAYMRQHHDGQKVYTFWDEEVPTAIEGLNLTRVFNIDDADFIYGSLVPYNAVAETYGPVLGQALARKLPFVCGNPDRVVGHGDGLHLCVGSLAEVYESMGGQVTWIGKPYRPIYDQAWNMLGKPEKTRMVAIGDALITDIGGAANFGCDVVWNIEGIHWDEVSSHDRIDADKMTGVLKDGPQPIGLLHGFTV